MSNINEITVGIFPLESAHISNVAFSVVFSVLRVLAGRCFFLGNYDIP